MNLFENDIDCSAPERIRALLSHDRSTRIHAEACWTATASTSIAHLEMDLQDFFCGFKNAAHAPRPPMEADTVSSEAFDSLTADERLFKLRDYPVSGTLECALKNASWIACTHAFVTQHCLISVDALPLPQREDAQVVLRLHQHGAFRRVHQPEVRPDEHGYAYARRQRPARPWPEELYCLRPHVGARSRRLGDAPTS